MDSPFPNEDIILDEKLDGWGWSYWNNLIQKYELRVR